MVAIKIVTCFGFFWFDSCPRAYTCLLKQSLASELAQAKTDINRVLDGAKSKSLRVDHLSQLFDLEEIEREDHRTEQFCEDAIPSSGTLFTRFENEKKNKCLAFDTFGPNQWPFAFFVGFCLSLFIHMYHHTGFARYRVCSCFEPYIIGFWEISEHMVFAKKKSNSVLQTTE